MKATKRLLAVALAAVAAPAEARAEGGYVNIGPLLSLGGGHERTAGIGGELSFMHYDSKRDFFGWGAFSQAQSFGSHGRYALGAQVGGPLGGELGVAYASKGDEKAGTWGTHLGLFGSIGLMSIGVRFTIPASTSGPGPGHGFEAAFVTTLKLPFPYGDPPPDIRMPSGRPLVVHGDARVAALSHGSSWA